MSVWDKLKAVVGKRRERELSPSLRASYEFDDWETRDQALKSLRKHRRKQLDEVEKRVLKEQIRVFNRERDKEVFYDNSILSGGGRLPSRKRKPSVNSRSCGFLGRGRL